MQPRLLRLRLFALIAGVTLLASSVTVIETYQAHGSVFPSSSCRMNCSIYRNITYNGTHPAVTPFLTNISAPSVVQTSSAQQSFYNSQVWNQTGHTLYAGHSMAWANYTMNVGGVITSVFSTAATFAISPASGTLPRVLVTQGSTTLANTTADLFTVHPVVSSSLSVTERIVSLINTTGGGIPLVGLYTAKTVVTENIQFDVVSTSGNWTYNNSFYRTNWYVNASHGYWLNSTTVSIPLILGTVVNLSSLVVSVNGTGATYQLATNTIYILLGPVAPAASDHVQIRYRAVPSILGPVPNIYFTAFVTEGVAGLIQSKQFFTELAVPAYNGLFFLWVNYSTPVSNITLTANGIAIPASALSISGSRITMLPGALTAYQSQQWVFVVTFNSVPQVVGLPGNSLTLYANGNGTIITLGEVLTFGVLLDLAYIAGLLIFLPGGYRHWEYHFNRKNRHNTFAELAGPVLVLVVLLVVYVVGTLPSL